ncbi:MAG: enoyl-CoA hydratase/isomerase family protein [Phyllobacterium sp.]
MVVHLEKAEHVATVRLDRPEALNAIDPETREELRSVFANIGSDDTIRVVILTGTGEKAFCTGSDLKKTMPPAESFAQQAFGGTKTREASETITKVLVIPQPIICAINGIAVAGGLELAMACDIRIAASHATFGLSEVRIGSIPGGGGTQRLPRLVGLTNAMPLLLGGGRIDADHALRIGLVSKITGAADLMVEAISLATQIAENAPLSVRAVKALVHQGSNLPLSEGLEMERMVFGNLRNTEDRIEGRRAFAEKRKPVYRGR